MLMSTEPSDGRSAYLRVGELCRRTGVNPETLRAWERRYGLLDPERTPGGFRLYSDADVERVTAMKAHLENGLAAAQAAELVIAGDVPAERPAPDPPGLPRTLANEADALAAALAAFDEAAANTALDRLLAAFGVDVVLDEVIIPFLYKLGERWESGTASVGDEHYASNLIRARLGALARGWGNGSGPRALLACAPGDTHDLGLLCFGIALHERGWRIDYLGANTPVESMRRLADSTQPKLIVVSAVHAAPATSVPELRKLAADFPLVLAGSAVTADVAADVGAGHLTESPVRAADRVAREYPRPAG